MFLLAPDPDDDAKRVLAHGKFNIGVSLPSREYRVEAILVPEENGEPRGSSARIVAGAACSRTVAELLGATRREESPHQDEAVTFLKDVLADKGWHDSAGLKTLADAQGISERTLHRGRVDLDLDVERRGFPASTWWRLPVAPDDRGATEEMAETDSRATGVPRDTAWRDWEEQPPGEPDQEQQASRLCDACTTPERCAETLMCVDLERRAQLARMEQDE